MFLYFKSRVTDFKVAYVKKHRIGFIGQIVDSDYGTLDNWEVIFAFVDWKPEYSSLSTMWLRGFIFQKTIRSKPIFFQRKEEGLNKTSNYAINEKEYILTLDSIEKNNFLAKNQKEKDLEVSIDQMVSIFKD